MENQQVIVNTSDKLSFSAGFIEKLFLFIGGLPSSQSHEIYSEFKNSINTAVKELGESRNTLPTENIEIPKE